MAAGLPRFQLRNLAHPSRQQPRDDCVVNHSQISMDSINNQASFTDKVVGGMRARNDKREKKKGKPGSRNDYKL